MIIVLQAYMRRSEQDVKLANELGARVRPRVQLDRLPDGLERHWEQTLDSEQRSER